MGLRIRVAAICRRNDALLLVEHEKEGQRYFLLPGGGMRRGERAEAAIAREVLEETTVRIEPKRLVCVCESIAPERDRHIVHFIFEALYIDGAPGVSQDPRVRGSLFAPIDSLETVQLRPPIQRWLLERLPQGFPQHLEYLEAMWI
jgi:ADP-ribose pyrophosphatase YjhB (NUDIX family)